MWSSGPRRSSGAVVLALAAAVGGAAGCEKLGIGGGGVVQIAAGGDFTCALTKAGDVYCWGDDARALQRRDTSELPPPKRTAPERVASITGAAFIAVAPGYGCAVLKSGRLSCFSEEGLKSLEMPAIDGVARVSLAKMHGVIEKTDGTIANFVRPERGDATPTPIDGLAGAKRAFTGELHGCALMDKGTVKCWGARSTGATADGEAAEGNAPRTLKSLGGVRELAVGSGFNCAVGSYHQVSCWGSNAFGESGQRGVGLAGPPLAKPTRVPFVNGAVSVAAGVHHACAVLESGEVTCWGSDEFGQCAHVQPGAPIPGLKDVTALALGEYHTCALDKSGHVRCWGRNLRGSLGNGTTVDGAVPVEVNVPH
jgi:alpha-tubulin suppressor-like RCC1 family protein